MKKKNLFIMMGKPKESLLRRATESRESAIRWLTSPQFGLGGEIPVKYDDIEEVINLLGRIEHGVLS